MGIARFVRDSQGRVGSGGNLLLVFAGFHAPTFSTALLFACYSLSFSVEPSDYMRPESYRDLSVQMFMNRDRGPRQRTAGSASFRSATSAPL